jgi:polyisoprenoid-binding protein YceI
VTKRFFLFFLLIQAVCFSLCAETQTFDITSATSSLTFDTSAQIHKVHGVSKDFSGTITGDPSDITQAKIVVKLDPKTFNTDNDKRDKVMREKSLEVDQYPWIEFESNSIEAATHQLESGKPIDAKIKGTLKMHGLSKEVEVPVKILLQNDVLTAEGDLIVILDEYKIFRPKVLFFQLQNEVNVHFKIGAKKATKPA